MARLLTTGAETGSLYTEGLSPNGTEITSTTSQARSGSRSFGGASGDAKITLSGALGTTYYARAYLLMTAFPASNTTLMRVGQGVVGAFTAQLQTDGTVIVGTQSGTAGSASGVLNTSQWYRIELKARFVSGAADEYELRIDGTTISSGTNSQTDSAADSFRINTVANVFLDDIALNDDSGADQNTWPGDAKVVMLFPISDNARDTLWTGGVGGTTNLFDAVNNVPPTGTATETDTTQIEHAGGAAGTTDRYDANMTSYTTAGIASGDTINLISLNDCDGEDIATGSKLLAFSVVSNPAIASPGNVTAGDNVGALGTFPTNWAGRGNRGITYNPSVTLGTSPVMRVVRPETATRVASVCFMGMYVDYTPAVVASLVIPHRHRGLIVR